MCMTLFKARHKHSVTNSNVASLHMTNQIILYISMRHLKDWSRSTMNEDRLTGLALLYIHQDKDTDKANIVVLIVQFHTRAKVCCGCKVVAN